MFHELIWKNRNKKILVLVMAVIISCFSCADFKSPAAEAPAAVEKTVSIIKSSIGKPLLPVASDETGQRFREAENNTGSRIHLKAFKRAVSLSVSSHAVLSNETRENKPPFFLFCENFENLKIVSYLHDSDGMKG